jgi:hypothetical protein
MARKKTAGPKVSVTARALVQRINRRLTGRDERLKASRGSLSRTNVGDYFVIDVKGNFVVSTHVDLETLARELGVLAPWEALQADEER